VNVIRRKVGGQRRELLEAEQLCGLVCSYLNWTSPIVTLSLGDSRVFGMGHTRGQRPMQWVELHSGDVVVMGGPARPAYHEVKKLLPHSSKLLRKGGRLSFTGRKVY
jgi:alkylated DNA repair protein (DNA oxidative demethylase)